MQSSSGGVQEERWNRIWFISESKEMKSESSWKAAQPLTFTDSKPSVLPPAVSVSTIRFPIMLWPRCSENQAKEKEKTQYWGCREGYHWLVINKWPTLQKFDWVEHRSSCCLGLFYSVLFILSTKMMCFLSLLSWAEQVGLPSLNLTSGGRLPAKHHPCA